jgi:hypothetical protein
MYDPDYPTNPKYFPRDPDIEYWVGLINQAPIGAQDTERLEAKYFPDTVNVGHNSLPNPFYPSLRSFVKPSASNWIRHKAARVVCGVSRVWMVAWCRLIRGQPTRADVRDRRL